MIYELRAYIGKTRTLYTAIFTNIEAAQNKAAGLRERCNRAEILLSGKITPLLANGNEYEPQTELTQYI